MKFLLHKSGVSGRYGLLLSAVLLTLWGEFAICSSQMGLPDGEMLALPLKQGIIALAGIALSLLISRFNFENLLSLFYFYALPVWGILVLLPFFGVQTNGMRGWLRIGEFTIQPSDLFRCIFPLLGAKLLSGKPGWKRDLTFIAAGLLWIIPVLLQPDLGTAAVYFGTLTGLLFVSGAAWYATCGIIALGAAGSWLLLQHFPYAAARLSSFISPGQDPWGGSWHWRQMAECIRTGGLTGRKLGNAIWSENFLPLAYNDSIYAVIAETSGLLGILVTMLLVVCFHFQLWRRISACTNLARRNFLAGTWLMFALQTILHMGVNTGLLPPTGITLPWISAGGSSLLGAFILLGLAMTEEKN